MKSIQSKRSKDVEGTLESSTVGTGEKHSPVVLVLAADKGYALPMVVSLYSALTNLATGQIVEVYVLDGGLDTESKTRLRRIVAGVDSVRAHLHYVQPDPTAFSNSTFRMLDRFNETIYYRLLIPELLPERFEKAIYLDADVVVEADLGRLWTEDMEGKALLAVQENVVSHPEWGVAQWEELGLEPNAPYFNSGVLVMDLEHWREEKVGPRVMDYLNRYRDQLNYPGVQEGLNAILAGEWKPIDRTWNVTSACYSERLARTLNLAVPELQVDDPTSNAAIIHFTDGGDIIKRPWLPGSTHPAREQFYCYLRRSGWFTGLGYYAWRAKLVVQPMFDYLKEASRPFRHRIGLKKTRASSSEA